MVRCKAKHPRLGPKLGANSTIRGCSMPLAKPKAKKKTRIHCALREQVWLNYTGQKFSAKCATRWCQNSIDVFNFQCGHKKAEAKGGATSVENLIPLCSRCNLSMGTMHFDEWEHLGSGRRPGLFKRLFRWFRMNR